MTTTVVFYCFMINDWKMRLQRQVERLASSGLYDAADEIFLFVTDTSNQQKEEVETLIVNYNKINLNYTNINYGEAFLALCKLDELARENDKERKILYFHTKGVFNKYKNFETKEIDELKIKGVDCWVEMMEYFLIDNWKLCLDKLEDNDIVGAICNGYWWWGNFWWTRSSHVRKIPPIKNFYTGSRWSVEAWIHESAPDKQSVKYYELRPTKYDPHYTIIPKYFYDNTINLSEIKIKITEAKYGYFAEQRDEGRSTPQESKIVDLTETITNYINNEITKTISLNEIIKEDVAPGQSKSVRIKFSTNIEPEKEYTITSFEHWNFNFVS